VAARRSLVPRAFGRLPAVRAESRAGLPDLAAAPPLPQVAPEPAAVPAPVVAYPPGTTGVRLPAPPDRPLAVLLPLMPLHPSAAAPGRTAVLLTHGGPPPGVVDALPAALLAAAAGAGFLATQLRRRVPLRRR
jgi:hypothetical protein